MSNELYTFILDWNDGTYISQLKATSINHSIEKWSANIDTYGIDLPNDFNKDAFLNSVENESIVSVSNTRSVWCITPDINDEIAIVHIVQTA